MADGLSIIIDADPSGLSDGLRRAEREIGNFEKRIQSISDVGQKLAGLGAAMTVGLTVPIVALGKSALQSYGEIQSLQKGLEAVMGSAARASEEFVQLKEVAKLPGLGMKEAVQGSINLQAIGISADRSREILSQFGNAVATVGKGRVEFERAIYGVQQLANTDFPLGEDLNIIKDALPQVSSLLKESFGTSRSDELQKLGISSQQVLDTILQGLGKLPRVSGGIKGAFENLSDAMQTSLGRIGKVIDDNLNISGIIDKITDSVDKAVTAFEGLNPILQKVILVIAGVTAAAGPLLVAVGGFIALIPTMTAGIAAIGSAISFLLTPIGLAIAAVTAGIVGIVTAVVANWGKIRPYLDETIERFKRLYNESFIFRTAVQGLGASLEASFRVGLEGIKNFYNNFKSVGKAILEIFGAIGDVIEGTLTFNFEKISDGVFRGFASINRSIGDIARNNITSAQKVYGIINETMDKWKNLSITDFKIPKIFGKEVEDETANGVINGLQKGKSGKTSSETTEIPEITSSLDTSKLTYTQQIAEQMFSLLEDKRWDAANSMLSKVLPTAVKTGIDNAIIEAARIGELRDKLNDDFSNLISSSASNALSDLFDSVGKAIAEGGNVAKAAGKSLLSSIGNFLKQMGQMLIQYGILTMIKGKLDVAAEVGGPVAIAAGLSAVAIGAAATAVGSAIGSFAGSGGKTSSNTNTTSSPQNVPNYTSTSYNSSGSGGNEVYFRISGADLIGVFNRNVSAQDRVTAG